MFTRVLMLILINCYLTAHGQLINEGLYHKKWAFQKKDSLVTSDIYLLSNSLNQPQFYTSHLAAGVCSDDLCRPVNINIYWDLLGRFIAYKTPPSDPLTKFDHIELTKADHLKLHRILADTSSLLRDYAPEDMIDKRIVVHSATTDAVTGATNKSFEDDIVSGAVYTVYTLWHFVNGEIPAKILRATNKSLNDDFIKQLLTSGNASYQSYILEEITENQLFKFKDEVLKLILSQDTYVPHYAIAKLPSTTWSSTKEQNWILENFSKMTLTVQNALLDKFKDQKISLSALKLLVDITPRMTEAQIVKSFFILEYNISSADKVLVEKITFLKNNKSKQLAERATQLLNRTKL